MIYLPGYLMFVLSVALAAGGIVLSIRLRTERNQGLFSILLYYEVFISTFGFYGIWGQALIRAILSTYISAELLQRFSDIAILLGLPFLVFGWLMLLQFAYHISGRKNSKFFTPVFLVFNFSILTLAGYLIAGKSGFNPVIILKSYFIAMNLLWTAFASVLIFLPSGSKSPIHAHDRNIISPVMAVIAIIQCIPLLLFKIDTILALIFIFTFFAGNTFLPLYITYGTLLNIVDKEEGKELSFDEFCKKYEISPRETDIVREICNGLSNKEISDKLFISLQTVKDHTHRIYIKTDVKSRARLISIVKEFKLL